MMGLIIKPNLLKHFWEHKCNMANRKNWPAKIWFSASKKIVFLSCWYVKLSTKGDPYNVLLPWANFLKKVAMSFSERAQVQILAETKYAFVYSPASEASMEVANFIERKKHV